MSDEEVFKVESLLNLTLSTRCNYRLLILPSRPISQLAQAYLTPIAPPSRKTMPINISHLSELTLTICIPNLSPSGSTETLRKVLDHSIYLLRHQQTNIIISRLPKLSAKGDQTLPFVTATRSSEWILDAGLKTFFQRSSSEDAAKDSPIQEPFVIAFLTPEQLTTSILAHKPISGTKRKATTFSEMLRTLRAESGLDGGGGGLTERPKIFLVVVGLRDHLTELEEDMRREFDQKLLLSILQEKCYLNEGESIMMYLYDAAFT